jgi:lipopolysaccharide transport system permease protein
LNPHAAQPVSPSAFWRSFWTHRNLILQMTRREVVGRYQGSVMGLMWSFLNPLFMLLVFTFVFSVVFAARWGTEEESKAQFAVVLFAGLIVHGLFAEILLRAPGTVVGNANYVKKVVFPLEVLPVITLGGALFHTLVSLLILIAAFAFFNGFLHWTVLLAPLVLLPLVVLGLGFAWMLASLGVFVRDISQVTGVLATALLFLSPVFFPVSALPEFMQPWMHLNPLTLIIEQVREVLIWGRVPDWHGLGVYLAGASAIAWFGFFWFQKTRKGFADVL